MTTTSSIKERYEHGDPVTSESVGLTERSTSVTALFGSCLRRALCSQLTLSGVQGGCISEVCI